MNEKPILFNSDMVLAILAGCKTQTRRIKKPSLYGYKTFEPSPYGIAGDTLWVRETWRTHQRYNDFKPSNLAPNSPIQYKADLELRNGSVGVMAKWRPSIFMPRWASRITLKVSSVRVESLQDISEADAIAEGIDHNWLGEDGVPYISTRDSFASLWDSINDKRGYGWDTNPMVWVVEFERIESDE